MASQDGVARVFCAWIAIITGDQGGAAAYPALAGVPSGAHVMVVAGNTVGLDRICALTGCGIAHAGLVALIDRSAQRAACACPPLAGIWLGTGIAIITRRPIRLRRTSAGARGLVAGADFVACVEGRATYWSTACAHAGLARVDLRTCVAVIARGPVRFQRIRASPCGGVAGSRNMALVARRRAHNTEASL